MPTQVSIPAHLPALLVGGAGAVLLCLAIAHGLLRTFMHARGVQPWTVRDTVASTMLLSLGAALSGAFTVLVAMLLSRVLSVTAVTAVVATLLLLLGALCVRLGLLALRKLT